MEQETKEIERQKIEQENVERENTSGNSIEILDNVSALLERLLQESRSSVNRMNIFDILEMFVDWYAATKRHDDGDIYKSIEINKDRFQISPMLVNILLNTVPWMNERFMNLSKPLTVGAKEES